MVASIDPQDLHTSFSERVHNFVTSLPERIKNIAINCFIIFTNTLLTGSVWLTKMLSFTVVGSFVLSKLTRPLHNINKCFAEKAISPIATWAKELHDANETSLSRATNIMLGTGRTENYLNSLKDTGKAIMALPWLALTVSLVAIPIIAVALGISATAAGVDPYISACVIGIPAFVLFVLSREINLYLIAPCTFDRLQKISEVIHKLAR